MIYTILLFMLGLKLEMSEAYFYVLGFKFIYEVLAEVYRLAKIAKQKKAMNKLNSEWEKAMNKLEKALAEEDKKRKDENVETNVTELFQK